jgi:deoxyribonuclease IV
MSATLIGAHMPTSKGLGNSLRRGKEIGCTAVQVFTSSPQQWRSKAITPEMVADIAKAREETGIRAVVSHDSYLVNLCAPNEEIAEKSKRALTDELLRCSLLGIPFVVSHMGAHAGCGEPEGLARVAEVTKEILEETPEDVTICMETTAGQGSSLNHRFEHLGWIIEACGGHPRLGVCLDTCHIFAAGYDIREREGFERTFDEFERLVGFDRLKVVHANDSKKPFGSRVDRHAHIGEGEIGPEAFRMLVQDPRFAEIPIVIETPDAEEMHAKNVARLWEWSRPNDV